MYRVTKKGAFVYTEALFAKGWQPVRDLHRLCEFSEDPGDDLELFHWTGPKIPQGILQDIAGTIAKFPHYEIGFMLYLNPIGNYWTVKAPPQEGTSVSLRFQYQEPPEGCMWVGTIHTHPQMSAFWSSTDMADQLTRGGLHIVYGLTDGRVASQKISMFTPDGVHDVKPEDIYQDPGALHEDVTHVNEAWYNEISRQYAPELHKHTPSVLVFNEKEPPREETHADLSDKIHELIKIYGARELMYEIRDQIDECEGGDINA